VVLFSLSDGENFYVYLQWAVYKNINTAVIAKS
jgi:hypothetical protein